MDFHLSIYCGTHTHTHTRHCRCHGKKLNLSLAGGKARNKSLSTLQDCYNSCSRICSLLILFEGKQFFAWKKTSKHNSGNRCKQGRIHTCTHAIHTQIKSKNYVGSKNLDYLQPWNRHISEQIGTLPNSIYESSITLIPKPSKKILHEKQTTDLCS